MLHDKNQIIIDFGGMELNDVWHSADDRDWKLILAAAPWSTRTAFCSVAFNNKMWMYSGKTGRADSWAGDIWAMSRRTSAE